MPMDITTLAKQLQRHGELKQEQGARGVAAVLNRARADLRRAVREVRALQDDESLRAHEPDDLRNILDLRPRGPRRLWQSFDRTAYESRVRGALLARMAGNVLGALVEGWSIQDMRQWAARIGDAFPPTDYWSKAPQPERLHYGQSRSHAFTRLGLDGVPVDDDVAYTVLGLLIAEQFGSDFGTDQVAEAWLKYLPHACTAEHVALENLRAGVSPRKAAERDNPYCQWIGADIRADPWGYVAPGLPQRAAEMAYEDAFLSHRRNGIYGAMFFAASIAAAFAVDDPIEALRIGLTEIPRQCRLARDVRWALRKGPAIRDYRDARAAVDRRFKGLHPVHTNNNACLTVFGLFTGGTDVTRVLSQTVAMGLDNDCTAATAGSIVGAVVGAKSVPRHWHRRFHNTVHSYLNGKRKFRIDDLVKRFMRQADTTVQEAARSETRAEHIRR